MKKNILITGGSRGIGKAIADKFSENGWKVFINSRKIADVGKYQEIGKMVKEAIDKHGGIDVLINNAGIVRDNVLVKMNEEDWDKVIETNLKGVFNTTKAVITHMIKEKRGHIINISSIAGIIGNIGQANYSAAKAGIIGFTKSLAREVGKRNIKVNVVVPGLVLTDMTKGLGEEKTREKTEENCLKRINTPEDVADFIYFLANTNNISGQVFNIDSRIL